MPKFSEESFSKLSTCHRDLQVLFFEVIKYFDCTVLEGHRSATDQNDDFKLGKSKLEWPNGKHNAMPSNAVDVAPYPINFNDTKRFYWFAGYVMGIAQMLKDQGKMLSAIRYGGDWKGDMQLDQAWNDLVHFEIIT